MEAKTLEQLEQEWIQLISEAKEMGLTIDEIQQFFRCKLEETEVERKLVRALA